jgi:hypothetical protein
VTACTLVDSLEGRSHNVRKLCTGSSQKRVYSPLKRGNALPLLPRSSPSQLERNFFAHPRAITKVHLELRVSVGCHQTLPHLELLLHVRDRFHRVHLAVLNEDLPGEASRVDAADDVQAWHVAGFI